MGYVLGASFEQKRSPRKKGRGKGKQKNDADLAGDHQGTEQLPPDTTASAPELAVDPLPGGKCARQLLLQRDEQLCVVCVVGVIAEHDLAFLFYNLENILIAWGLTRTGIEFWLIG